MSYIRLENKISITAIIDYSMQSTRKLLLADICVAQKFK